MNTNTANTRQKSYVIVNSVNEFAYKDSLDIAKIRLKQMNNYKVVLNGFDTGLTPKPYHMAMRHKKGEIHQIQKCELPNAEMMDGLIHRLKNCLLITSTDHFNPGDYNLFNNDRFIKKNIDIILHRPFLKLHAPELNAVKIIERKAQQGLDCDTNVFFRIYPDVNFKFDSENFQKYSQTYGKIHALGIFLAQIAVNINSQNAQHELLDTVEQNLDLLNLRSASIFVQKYAYYNFLTLGVSGISTDVIEEAGNFLAFNSIAPTKLVNEYLDFLLDKKEIIKETEEKKEQTLTVDEAVKNCIKETEKLSMEEKIKLLDKPESIGYYLKKHHKTVSDKCTFEEFDEKVNEASIAIYQDFLKGNKNK